jgi:hypothetical protein
MSALTDTWEGNVLTWLFRPQVAAPTRPTAPLHLAIFTSDPGETGVVTGEPATTTGYARQPIQFDAAFLNDAIERFDNNGTGDFGSIAHVAIVLSNVRGTADVVARAALSGGAITITNGNALEFGIGALALTAN